MTREVSPGSINAEDEIAALIATLRETGERLEELTGGEVDSVADPEGRTFLLRGVHQQLRNAEAAEQAAILNALPAHIALLDAQGLILSVNEAWRKFAISNTLRGPESALGVNYLDVCDRTRGPYSSEARGAAAGIRAVLDGTTQRFSLEYPCHSPAEQRWFLMTVTPLSDDGSSGAVIMHLNITDKKLAENSAIQERNFTTAAIDSMPGLFYLIDERGRFVRWNRNFEEVSGYSFDEISRLTPTDLFAGSDKEIIAEKIMEVFRSGDATVEADFVSKDQTTTPYFFTGAKVLIDQQPFLVGMGIDIAMRRRAEIRVKYLSRVYVMLSSINALIVRVQSRDELYQEMCRIAVEDGGFRMSLIGIVDRNTQKIVPVASGGKDDELLTAIKDRLSSNEGAATTMVARAISEKKIVVSNDSLNDSRVVFSPQYAKSGIRSMAIFPLMVADVAIGVLALYASEVEFFHEEEMNLLTGLANDIAFALANIGNEEKISRLTRIQAVMSGINAVIVRVQDHQELFNEACRIIFEQGRFAMGWIGTFDPATLDVTPVAWAGETSEMLTKDKSSADEESPRGKGAVGRAIRERRPVFTNDLAVHGIGGPRLQEILRLGFRSQITLPLYVEQVIVATLTMYARERNFFDEEERRQLTELAGNISFALEHIGKEEKIARLSRIHAVMSGINAAILHIRDRNALFNEACKIAVKQGGFGIAWVGLLNQETLEIAPVAWAGVEVEKFLAQGQNPLQSDGLPGQHQGMVSRAYIEKRAVFINDLIAEPGVGRGRRKEAIRRGYRSSISLPLLVEGVAVGNLTLFTSEREFFNVDELKLLNVMAGDISFALEHIGKEEKITRLTRVQAVMSGINAVIVRVRNSQELFIEACRVAVEDGNFGTAWVGAFDTATLEVSPIAWAGTKLDPEGVSLRTDVATGEGVVARAIREKHPVFDNDIASPSSAGGERRARALQHGFRSLAALPFIVGGAVVGQLSLYTKEPNFFSEGELKLLSELAGNISFALEHINKEEKIARLSRIQAVMSGINAVIVRARDLQGLFDEACSVAVEHGNFGTAWIGVLDASTLKSVQVAWAGRDLHPPSVKVQIDVATGQGVASRAIRGKRLVFDNNIASPLSAGGARRSMALQADFRSMVALPFIVGGTVAGHLSLYTKEINFFNDDELKLLSDMAGNISFAIENINRKQKLDKLARIRSISSEVNAAIVRTHDREALLRETCRIVNTYGKFDMVWIAEVDQLKQKVQPVAWVGFSSEAAHAVSWSSIHAAQGTLGKAIQTRKAAVRNDIGSELPTGKLRQEARHRGCHSTASLPLVIDGNVVALIGLFAPEVEFFDEEEIQLLTEVSSNISFALADIEKEQKITRLNRIHEVTGGIHALIVRVRDRQELFDHACRIAVEHGRFGIAWIGTLDPQSLDVTPVAHTGFQADESLVNVKSSASVDHPMGRGVVGQAIRARTPVFVDELPMKPGAGERRKEAIRRGYRSRIALPLMVDGDVVGVMVLFAKEQDFFNKEELKLLSELAGNISFALEHINRQQRLEKVSQIVESSQDGIVSTTTDDTILTWNAGAEKMFGYTSKEVIGQKVGLLVPDDLRQDTQQRRQRNVSSGNFDAYESERLTKGQRRLAVSVNYSVIKDVANKVLGIATIYRDITERKQAESALLQLNEALEDKVEARTVDLRRAQHEAEQANQAKSSFLAAMSHEIRTPMNGVIGMIDVLQQSSLKGDQMEMVDLIRDSAFSLLGIINDILDFSKIEAGKLELEREAIEVAEVVEGVCGLLNGMAEKRDVVLIVYIDPAIPAQVLGDALRLRQVLVNLVNNAIKFSGGQSRAGRVSVRALLVEHSPEQVIVEFRVADNGVGMDEETQARLFTAFTQADVSTTRNFGGTGLGLVIANNLVELMGGEITVQSAPDKGATFKVRLPFRPLPAGAVVTETVSDVVGLCCVVVGAAGGLADDLAAYLKHAHADVERTADLAGATAHTTGWRGLSVWVVDTSDEPGRLEQMHAVARAQEFQDVRLVVVLIERGKRRRPRVVTPDMITVDGNALNRRTFLRAVAVAAGRASLEVETGGKRTLRDVAIIAPSRENALRQGRLILVAEDNETNQKVILRQLTLLGFTADVVADGLKALARWRSGDYSMLLTDLHMPKMDGYELTQAIRAEEKDDTHMPIIALTANALKGEAERCRAVGMDDYRSKPSPLEELKSVLDKWLPSAKPEPDAPILLSQSSIATQQAATAVPVDVSILEGLVGDDPDVVREFLQNFRSSASKIAAELRAACVTSQTDAAVAAAHKLKSSAHAVGASALGELCAAMEEAGKAGNAEALTVLLLRFEAEMAVVEDYLDKL